MYTDRRSLTKSNRYLEQRLKEVQRKNCISIINVYAPTTERVKDDPTYLEIRLAKSRKTPHAKRHYF